MPHDAMPEEIISVKYAHIDGAHFFTSDDKLGEGLCAAHQDLKIAYEETSHQLKVLLKLNHNIDADVEPMVPLEELQKWVASVPPNPHIRPRVTGEVDWREKRRAA